MTPSKDYLTSIIDSGELTKLERRLINIISSMTKINRNFTLRAVIDTIEEKNDDLVLEALHTLILRKIIFSPHSTKMNQKKR